MEVAQTSLDLWEAQKAVTGGQGTGRRRGGGGEVGEREWGKRGERSRPEPGEEAWGSQEGKKEENVREEEERARAGRGEGKVTAGISEGPIVKVLSAR